MSLMKRIKENLNEYAKLFREKKIVEILLIVLFAVQFFVIVYFNLELLSSHTDYDSSWTYLRTVMVWNEKALISDKWVETTNLFFDSSMLLAVLLFGLTGDIFLSYGLANVIVLACALLCLNSIMDLLGIRSIRAKWCAFNLMICPYLTNGFSIGNDLGYFSCMLSGPAYYSLRAVIVLLIVREYLSIRKSKKPDILGVITLLLCAVSGLSCGIFIVVVILLPIFVFLLEQVFLDNSFKPLIKPEAVFSYLCALSVIAGKLSAELVLGIEAIDSSRTWTPLVNLFTNFGAPMQGFMALLGVLPVERADEAVLSSEGLFRVFPILIFAVLILSIGYSIKLLKKDFRAENYGILFLITILAVNYLTFGLFNVQYGAAIFEERYLISTFLIVILLAAYYLQHADSNSIFMKALVVVLLVCLAADNYDSDRKYAETTNDSWQMEEIRAIADSQDAKLVYLWGDELTAVGRSLRVYDMGHIYKCINSIGLFSHWGDYSYCEDNADYSGSTLLIYSNGSEIVPQYIRDKYSFIKKLDYVSIYRSDSNPIDRVVGITGDTCVDFPSSPGIYTDKGLFDGNSFVSNGMPGYVLWGPYTSTKTGVYDFSIDYSILAGDSAAFDVSIDNAAIQLGTVELSAARTSATIPDISLEEGHSLEYRVYTPDGTRIKIDKITITKK